jgi:Type VI secretion system spike protein VgrG3-like, C-terminal
MAVRVDDFGKTGRVETNGKPAESTKSSYNIKAEHSNVFQALLNMLKPEESSQPVSNLRNKPASSELVKHDHHRVSKNPGAVRGLNGQNVNNLAASTLIAMAAISSGPNRIGGFYSRRAGSPGLSGGTSRVGEVCASIPQVGTSLCPGQEIGTLSAHFESGEKGPGVIGYDHSGGTSYGTYQISSRAGTMRLFIDYLSERAPDLAGKLKAAGPANTGSRSGRMPEVWKKITAADPVQFAKLQYDFIEKSHYLPALQEISDRTGLDISKAPRALQEVLWSTAVQHGPKGAAKIFTKAIKRAQYKNDGVKMAQLIGAVYDMRAGQFGSSGPGVRAAVRGRFREEGRMALAMLSDPFLNSESLRA